MPDKLIFIGTQAKAFNAFMEALDNAEDMTEEDLEAFVENVPEGFSADRIRGWKVTRADGSVINLAAWLKPDVPGEYLDMLAELDKKPEDWRDTDEGEEHLARMDKLWYEMSESELEYVLEKVKDIPYER